MPSGLATSLLKKLQSLRKGAGGRNSLKWGVVEMVLWSVRGWSLWLFFFLLFDVLSPGKKTYWTPYHGHDTLPLHGKTCSAIDEQTETRSKRLHLQLTQI
jgi:hypothetical protein